MLFEFCSKQVVREAIPKPSGLGMVSIFKTSAARAFLCVFPRIDARRIWRLWKITMLDWPLLHPHVPPECREDLWDALFGFIYLIVYKQGVMTPALAFGFRTGLALGYADFAGHDGWSWICSTASGTQRLLR